MNTVKRSLKNFVIVLLFSLLATSAFAQDVFVNWNSTTSGDLDGTTVTLSGMDSHDFFSADLTGPDYSAAPGSVSQQTVSYSVNSAVVTATFSQPVSGIRLYLVFWRPDITFTFSEPFTVSSGLTTSTVSRDQITTPPSAFGDGIIEFTGPVSSLTITSNAPPMNFSRQGITFSKAGPANSDPTANAGGDQQVCASGASTNVTLDGSGSSDPDGDALTYTWKEGAATIATSVNPSVSLSVGTHTIELTVDDGNGGTDTDEVVIEIFANPTADAGADQEVFQGFSTQIGGGPTGSGGTGALTFSWTPTDGLDNPAIANPTATPAATTTYTVTVTDANGCESTDQMTVTVLSNADVITMALADVQALINNPSTPSSALGALQDAVDALNDALAASAAGDTKDMLDAMRDAADALEKARHKGANTDPIATQLSSLARHTAVQKRDEAFACDPTPSGKMLDDIEDGDKDLADGDAEVNGTYHGDGIKDYRKAWEDYCDALNRCQNPKAVSSEQYTVTSPQVTVHSFALHQNYPNPFNPSTTIQFDLVDAGYVSLNIYNSAGQLVRTLVSGDYAPGAHKIVWDARDDSGARVASGLYLYTIKAGQQFAAQKKLLLMK